MAVRLSIDLSIWWLSSQPGGVMEYEFVTRSIPTLWKGCYLLVARALPPVVFMAQHLRFVPRSSGFLPQTLIRLNSRDKRSKARSWSVEALNQVAMRRKGRCSIVVLMSLIEGLLPAQSCVVFIMHLATARHIALCRDAAALRVVVESYRACLEWRPLPLPLRLHTHEPGCTRTARFHHRF